MKSWTGLYRACDELTIKHHRGRGNQLVSAMYFTGYRMVARH